MDTKTYIGIIVGLMVSGLILASMVPIFTEVTATDDTFENDGYFSMDAVDESTDTKIRLDNTLSKVYVDDVEITVNSTNPNNFTILGADNFLVRWQPSNTLRIYSDSVKWAFATTDTFGYVELDVTASTVTVTSDKTSQESATITLGNTPFVISADDDAKYVMKFANEGAYVTDESVCLMGISIGLGFNTAIGVYGVGTIEDGMTLSTAYLGTNITEEVVYADPVADYSVVNGYVGLYELNSYASTITVGEGEPQAISYTYFIVPAEVTAEKTYHGDVAFNSIINTIPMLAGVGLLMAGVYYFISRK